MLNDLEKWAKKSFVFLRKNLFCCKALVFNELRDSRLGRLP